MHRVWVMYEAEFWGGPGVVSCGPIRTMGVWPQNRLETGHSSAAVHGEIHVRRSLVLLMMKGAYNARGCGRGTRFGMYARFTSVRCDLFLMPIRTVHSLDQPGLVYKGNPGAPPHSMTTTMTALRMPNSKKIQEFSEGQQPRRLPISFEYMIISYVCDFHTLLLCSTICRAWYYTVAPRLHYSLTTTTTIREDPSPRVWPRPLQESYKLNLLPLVRQFNILSGFTLEQFHLCDISHFSAFTNLRELRIDGLQVSEFIPNIQRHFKYFAPTVESLTLVWPKASCRQILYLIGLFKKLRDLTLSSFHPTDEDETTAHLALVPPSTPPLSGRLTLESFTSKAEKLLDWMIALCGGLRFRHVDLFYVECMHRVVDACAETLEILELDEYNRYCKDFLDRGEGLKLTIYRLQPLDSLSFWFGSLAVQVPSNAQNQCQTTGFPSIILCCPLFHQDHNPCHHIPSAPQPRHGLR